MSDSKREIVLPDLQSLLKSSIGDKVIVLNYETSKMLKNWENYGSTILKVTAKIKKNEEEPIQDLELVAKTAIEPELQRYHINSAISFKKEIFIFDQLGPTYLKIQKEAEFKDSELIDFLPKCYGHRLSSNPESEIVDQDIALLMENLCFQGYCIMDRKIGLDLSHANLVLTTLAKFHCLGIVCRYRKPEFFKIAQTSLEGTIFKKNPELIFSLGKTVEKILFSNVKIDPYKDRIIKYLESVSNKVPSSQSESIWASFVHADCWVNNLLFHHDKNGHPDRVKLIDFQLTHYDNCLIDLTYFLFSSCSREVLMNNFEEMLTSYQLSFSAFLEKLKIDSSCYTRESFNENLKFVARSMLMSVLLVLKIATFNADENVEAKNMLEIIVAQNSSNFEERSFAIVQKFVDKNWI